MEPCLIEDDSTATVYLEPQQLSYSIGRMERLNSTNDSGIVEFHGSRSSSKIGLSIPNDTYRVFDSDQENQPATPRVFYPAEQRSNGHAPLSTQFSYPRYTPKSNGLPNKLFMPSHRATDDTNIYTSIDEASLSTPQDNSSPSKLGDSPPQICYRPSGSRQSSVESTQSRGSENLLYEPPRVDRGRSDSGWRALGAGKAVPFSGKCCLNVFFSLIAVAAFALALSQLVRSSMDNRYERLVADYQGIKEASEELKQTQLKIENNFSEMLMERLRELNDSVISDVASYDSISLLLFRLLINDSDLRRRLFDSFEDRMDLLKAKLESKVDSAEQRMEQLDSQTDQQVRMYIGGLLPVNMSGCTHLSQRKGTTASDPEHSTEHVDLTGKFVLRAFCTTEGGKEAFLEYNATNPNVYMCTCRGKHNDAASRYCVLHYWTCPYL